jgi:hypothetical protein
MDKKIRIRIRDEQPEAYFRVLKKLFFENKILKFGSVIRDGKSSDPVWKKFGSGIEKIRIRDKHPGFATLIVLLGDAAHQILPHELP